LFIKPKLRASFSQGRENEKVLLKRQVTRESSYWLLEILGMTSPRRVGVKFLSLSSYGEKQQLKNTLMGMNSQEKICLHQLPHYSSQKVMISLRIVLFGSEILKTNAQGSNTLRS